jgi:hypothetical protein
VNEINDGVSQAELARRWVISRQAVNAYVKRGMPTTSIEDAEKWKEDNVVRPHPKRGFSPSDLNGAKLQNLKLEAEKKKIQIARLKREQIDKRKVTLFLCELFAGLAQAVKYAPGITREQAATVCKYMKNEAERIADELEQCMFEEGDLEDEEEETDGEDQDMH